MPRIVVLVSDQPEGALHQRAHSLFSRLPSHYQSRIVCHEGSARRRVAHFLDTLRACKPDLIFVLDPIYAAIAATRVYTLTQRTPVVVDTGDLVYELAREVNRVGLPSLAIVRWAEQTALSMARSIIVRSTYHREWLKKRGFSNVTVIPDGVDLTSIFPSPSRPLRDRWRIELYDIVVGGVGSIIWNSRHQTCYGWDLVEALALLRELPVRGLLFGDGDGLDALRRRAADLGVDGRITFAGAVGRAGLNDALNALDIGLISAPDSELSRVRTTGKLPLYLASDRFVLSTTVGTASTILPSEMLLPYYGGERDDTYPLRLAQRIRELHQSPAALRLNGRGVALARAHFDYDRLAQNLESVLAGIA